MRAQVTTQIDGNSHTFTGTLNSSETILNTGKGMILTILPSDTVVKIESKKRVSRTSVPCALDIHKWFRVSKQI